MSEKIYCVRELNAKTLVQRFYDASTDLLTPNLIQATLYTYEQAKKICQEFQLFEKDYHISYDIF